MTSHDRIVATAKTPRHEAVTETSHGRYSPKITQINTDDIAPCHHRGGGSGAAACAWHRSGTPVAAPCSGSRSGSVPRVLEVTLTPPGAALRETRYRAWFPRRWWPREPPLALFGLRVFPNLRGSHPEQCKEWHPVRGSVPRSLVGSECDGAES